MIKVTNAIAIKIKKPVDVKLHAYIDFDVENNDKDPKFVVGDHVRRRRKNRFRKRLHSKLV